MRIYCKVGGRICSWGWTGSGDHEAGIKAVESQLQVAHASVAPVARLPYGPVLALIAGGKSAARQVI